MKKTTYSFTHLVTGRNVTVNVEQGSDSCRCCGGHKWGHAQFVVNGRLVGVAVYDGHLGSGIWRGETWELYVWALGFLGVTVELQGLANNERLLIPNEFYLREDGDYTLVPMPAQEVLTFPVGLDHPDESWIKAALERGDPMPQPTPYTKENVLYSDDLTGWSYKAASMVAKIEASMAFTQDSATA